MISKEEIKLNINSEWHIPLDTQKQYRYGLCRFIINTCQKINLSYETASLAMLIINHFFIKNLYFNFNKLTIACSALLLSSKNETSQSKFNDIWKEYSFTGNKGLESAEEPHKIKEHIGKYEIYILKQLNYNIPEEFPYDFIYAYSDLLYPDNSQEISNVSIKVAVDSYFTYANNIYKSYVVAIACLVIAAKFLEIPTVFEENFKHIDNMRKIHRKNISIEEFNKELSQYDSQFILRRNNKQEYSTEEDDYFRKLSLHQKLHPSLKIDDLIECIYMIMEYYEDMRDKSNLNLNSMK